MRNQGDSDQVRPQRAPGSVNGWLVAILLVLVFALYWRLSGGLPLVRHDRTAAPRPVTPKGKLSEIEQTQTAVNESVSPSVVHVQSSDIIGSRVELNPIRESVRGSGSGFVWDHDGHIVTSFHVVRGGSRFFVTFDDNSHYEAIVIGQDPGTDLAVLKLIDSNGSLKPIPVGTSHDLLVGQNAYAIGHPFSLGTTFTTGVISALGQVGETPQGQTISDLIQTQVPINPGCSGGPLVDSSGRLIGVNTAIVSTTEAYAGIAFAIPVDRVNQIVPRLIRGTGDAAPVLGITLLPDALVKSLREEGVISSPGALVWDVRLNSVLAAGLRPSQQLENGKIKFGDLIIAVDGQKVESALDLARILENREVGETVNVLVRRDEGNKTIRLTLRSRQESGR